MVKHNSCNYHTCCNRVFNRITCSKSSTKQMKPSVASDLSAQWKHAHIFSLWQIICIERMLAFGTNAMRAKHYHCEKSNCQHVKIRCQRCKIKACSSCGTKSTEQWIATHLEVMPDCEHQHITFTLPNTLWPIFRHNRGY